MKFRKKQLRALRELKGYNYNKLALELYKQIDFKVTNRTLENWEIGRTKPDVFQIGKLAEFYSRDVNFFYN